MDRDTQRVIKEACRQHWKKMCDQWLSKSSEELRKSASWLKERIAIDRANIHREYSSNPHYSLNEANKALLHSIQQFKEGVLSRQYQDLQQFVVYLEKSVFEACEVWYTGSVYRDVSPRN